MGQGNTTSIGENEVPSVLPPIALDGKAVAMTIGDSHACALLDDQTMRCWGNNMHGQLGQDHNQPLADGVLPKDLEPVQLF